MNLMQAIRRSLALFVVLLLVLSASAAAQKITFIQMSDAHLFDAGKKRKTEKPEGPTDKASRLQERRDTWATWEWAFDSIDRLNKVGQHINFLVFTGDFGLEKVTNDPNFANVNKDTKEATNNNPEECWDFGDAVDLVAKRFESVPVKKIYLVRGNNDLNDEDPADGERFDKFYEALASNPKLKNKIINLTPAGSKGTSENSQGYTIVGLDSSSFKNKPTPTPPPATPTQHPCPFVDTQSQGASQRKGEDAGLKDGSQLQDPPKVANMGKNAEGEGFRDKYQLAELTRVADVTKNTEVGKQILIFTHIPDMDDPGCVKGKAPCSSVASWNISYQARSVWSNLVQKKNVLAIFAGHFHDNRRLVYKRPYTWPFAKGKKKEQKQTDLNVSTAQQTDKNKEDSLDDNEIKAIVLDKTYVVPPLAPKFQMGEDEQSIGFALVTVAGKQVDWKTYWVNTLPPSSAQTENRTALHESNCWCVIIVAIVILAIILFLLGWLLVAKMITTRVERLRNEQNNKFAEIADAISNSTNRP